MKKIIICTCLALLSANLLLGVLLSAYEWFNVLLSSGAVILTGLFMLLAACLALKDGFKAALLVICPALGVVEYVLCVFSPDRVKDNPSIVAIVVLVAFQTIFLLTAKIISDKIK